MPSFGSRSHSQSTWPPTRGLYTCPEHVVCAGWHCTGAAARPPPINHEDRKFPLWWPGCWCRAGLCHAAISGPDVQAMLDHVQTCERCFPCGGRAAGAGQGCVTPQLVDQTSRRCWTMFRHVRDALCEYRKLHSEQSQTSHTCLLVLLFCHVTTWQHLCLASFKPPLVVV